MSYNVIKLRPELYNELRREGAKRYGHNLSTPYIIYLMLKEIKRR